MGVYPETKTKILTDMVMKDKELWEYFVDKDNCKKPKYNRTYVLNILASKRPDFIK